VEQTSENKLFNPIKRIDDKEPSWIAQESNQPTNKPHLLCRRLNITLYAFLLQPPSTVIRSAPFSNKPHHA